MSGAAWTFLGLAVTAFLTAGAAIYTSWSARRAARLTTDSDRIDQLWARVDQLTAQVDALRADQARQDQRIRAHTIWDTRVEERLRVAGITVDPPPPLT
jgi:outer membrane murein-binding lipoprotein Lpp